MEAGSNSILIVDDNHQNVKVLGLALKEKAYSLTVAFNGPDALSIVNSTHIDLILLDIMMPGMDGYEVCRQLKAKAETAAIPVIFITALTEINSIVRGFEVGGVDYITKPFKKEELYARVGSQLEITNQRIQLEKQTLELKNTISSRDKLYSIIAHDLRSPLANIKTILMALTDGQIDADSFNQLVGMLLKSTNETYDLLENLLYWSKSQLNAVKPEKQSCPAEEIISEAISLLKPVAETKEINLDGKSDENPTVLADKNMMKTVMRNLISNALKFTPRGGEISVWASESENDTRLLVEDTGLGISPENMDKLFDKKKSFTTAGTESEKGSGLGLKLIYDFVKMHDGEIEVDSVLGKGTKFTVCLPKK